jgi:hypothetical protein
MKSMKSGSPEIYIDFLFFFIGKPHADQFHIGREFVAFSCGRDTFPQLAVQSGIGPEGRPEGT